MRFVQIDRDHWINVGSGSVAWLQESGSGDWTIIMWTSGKYIRVHKTPTAVIEMLEER